MRSLKINNEKDTSNGAEYEETTVTDDPIVIKESIFFNKFECGNNFFDRLDTTCEQACMATPRDEYHMELYRTITACNDCNSAPLFNEKILT